MNQMEFIHHYNDKYRPKFNKDLFTRSDDELINAIRNVIYSCERESTFIIKVLNFEVIDSYDTINHILWEYFESIKRKNKKGDTKKVKDNLYDFINLKDSDIKIIKVTYFIQINEKKDGLVNDTISVYIAIPRIVDDFYFRINGNMYSAMYQIVDASTYNNSAAKNPKKQSITFKTTFSPIRVYRYNIFIKDITGMQIPCTYFIVNMFKKSVLLIKYIIAKMGLLEAMEFLHIVDVKIVESISTINRRDNYIIPVREFYIVVPKILYTRVQVVQSFIYTLYSVINYMKDASYSDIFDRDMWLKALGAEFISKDLDTIIDKGKSVIDSVEFIYDISTMEDLKLPMEDKSDIYRVLRWMMYEFNSLRQKDNLDISTKKVRWAEYIAALYAEKLFYGICHISDMADRADLLTIKKALQIQPTYLIKAITNSKKCQLVNYVDNINDIELIKLKFTYKGISGIGEKSSAISSSYRSVHPSHLGRVDVDSSSNSDPGVSGTICPLAVLHDGHFDEYEEPDTWESDLNKVIDAYRAIDSRVEMVRLLSDHEISTSIDTNIVSECASVARDLLKTPLYVNSTSQYIPGIDIFGDGYFYYLEE